MGGGGGKDRKCKFQLSVDNVAAPTTPPPPPAKPALTCRGGHSGSSRSLGSPGGTTFHLGGGGGGRGVNEQHRALPPDPAKENKIQPARAQAQERFGAEIMVRGQTQGEATKRTLGLPAGGEGRQSQSQDWWRDSGLRDMCVIVCCIGENGAAFESTIPK